MTITLDAITLPDDLSWADEFDWTPTQQQQGYSLTGALIIETGVKQAGRPITLTGGEQAGWITRTELESLYAKLDDNIDMTLTLHDGRIFTVRFNQSSQPISARPVIDYNNPAAGDFYTLTLRFITV